MQCNEIAAEKSKLVLFLTDTLPKSLIHCWQKFWNWKEVELKLVASHLFTVSRSFIQWLHDARKNLEKHWRNHMQMWQKPFLPWRLTVEKWHRGLDKWHTKIYILLNPPLSTHCTKDTPWLLIGYLQINGTPLSQCSVHSLYCDCQVVKYTVK